MKTFKDFLLNEEGLGTVEIVIILGVLVTVALLFKDKLIEMVNKLIGDVPAA